MQNIQIPNTKKKLVKDFQWRQKRSSNCRKKKSFGSLPKKKRKKKNFLIE